MSSAWFKKKLSGRSQSPHAPSPPSGTSASSPQPPYSRPATRPTSQNDPYMSAPSSSSTSALPKMETREPQMTAPSTSPNAPAPSPPISLNNGLALVKKFLATMPYLAEAFAPLTEDMGQFIKAWNGYQRQEEVQEAFIEFASKLKALHAFASEYPEEEPIDPGLQQRLEAIQQAVKLLTEAIVAKQDGGPLMQVAQSLGDVAVVNTMFRRVSSLLQVFQLEGQGEANTLMVTIQLGTEEQLQLTNTDVLRDLVEQMHSQPGSDRVQYDAANQPGRSNSAAAKQNIFNNNANENYIEGDAQVFNNNSNENEIYGDEGSSIVNNNPNLNYVYGSPSPSGSSSSGVRIENNNGNINRIYGGSNGSGGSGGFGGFGGSRGGSPPGWPAHFPPFGGSGSLFGGSNSPFSGTNSPNGGAWPGGIFNNNGNKNIVRSAGGTPSWMPSPSSGRRLDD